LDIGSNVTVSVPDASKRSSISAEHDCRTRPSITMVQIPHTCSRQLISQTGGVVCLPSTVTGVFANIHQHGNDVEIASIRYLERLPIRSCTLTLSPLYFDLKGGRADSQAVFSRDVRLSSLSAFLFG
jgi:hypothetical protein